MTDNGRICAVTVRARWPSALPRDVGRAGRGVRCLESSAVQSLALALLARTGAVNWRASNYRQTVCLTSQPFRPPSSRRPVQAREGQLCAIGAARVGIVGATVTAPCPALHLLGSVAFYAPSHYFRCFLETFVGSCVSLLIV
jgi:uncharacterized membrane protein YeaQ/YmgE (transglycosylase-associated protein family)